jgi:hypothetical protein
LTESANHTVQVLLRVETRSPGSGCRLASAMRFMTILVMIVITLALPPGQTVTASTCLMFVHPDPVERLRSSVQFADLVVLAEIIEEMPVDYVLTGNQIDAVPRRDGQLSDRAGLYQSRVRIHEVLKGSFPDSELTLNHLGDEWQCAGGPRIPEGTRVLLMLSGSGDSYQTGPLGSPVLLMEGGAYLADYGVPTRDLNPIPQRIGSTIGVIHLVSAEAAGTSRDAVYAFAEPSWNRDTLAWGAAVGMLVFGLMGWAHVRTRQ